MLKAWKKADIVVIAETTIIVIIPNVGAEATVMIIAVVDISVLGSENIPVDPGLERALPLVGIKDEKGVRLSGDGELHIRVFFAFYLDLNRAVPGLKKVQHEFLAQKDAGVLLLLHETGTGFFFNQKKRRPEIGFLVYIYGSIVHVPVRFVLCLSEGLNPFYLYFIRFQLQVLRAVPDSYINLTIFGELLQASEKWVD